MSRLDPSDLASIVEKLRDSLEQSLFERVEAKIESFRRAVYVRDEWCCNEMREFAMEVWQAPKPKRSDAHVFGSVAYQLREHNVNYCPFCGVFVGAAKH